MGHRPLLRRLFLYLFVQISLQWVKFLFLVCFEYLKEDFKCLLAIFIASKQFSINNLMLSGSCSLTATKHLTYIISRQ